MRDRYPLKSQNYLYQGVDTSAKQGRWEIHDKVGHSGIPPIMKIPYFSCVIQRQFVYKSLLKHKARHGVVSKWYFYMSKS